MKTSVFLLKNTPNDLWAVSARDPMARDQLREQAKNTSSDYSLPTFCVLIAYVDQLHNFVQHVPSLAWELLEYAQEPLEIMYPERKLSLSGDEDAPKICVRWAKHPKLLKFLQKEGPVWTTPAFLNTRDQRFSYTTIDCYDKNYPYEKVKTVVINADDTFTFIR